MRKETIAIIYEPSKILLGFKNPEKKFGGKWNGFGGGVEKGESLEDCSKRETLQETGVIIRKQEKVGRIFFSFKSNEQEHDVFIYQIKDYDRTPKPSEDFVGYAWFNGNNLPDKMMPADPYWLPFFANGKMFKGNVILNKNNGEFEVISHNIYEVNNLD